MAVANKLRRKRQAKSTLNKLFEHPDNVLVVHYSCESFYDRPEGASPRTTSIAVRQLASGQTESFSIHQVAEELGIEAPQIGANYTRIETEMLVRFFRFVSRHAHHRWLHWNMRDINYGFAALEHRARVLGVQPEHVPDTYKIDLARLLIDIYSAGYAAHPRLKNVLERNRISLRDFLTGAEEADAFENADFVKLHLSTLRKVDVIAALAERVESEGIETRASWWTRNGGNVIGAVDAVTDNWMFRLLGLLAVVVTVTVGLFTLLKGVF